MKLYVIFRRNGWATSEELSTAAKRSIAEGERLSDRVRWIRSYVLAEAAGNLGTVCVYQATSPDALREHAEAAGLPCDEVVEVADTVIARDDPVRTA